MLQICDIKASNLLRSKTVKDYPYYIFLMLQICDRGTTQETMMINKASHS